MQLRAVRSRWPQVRLAGVVLGTALAAFWLRGPILQVGGLTLGATALGFLALPLDKIFERRLPRPAAALLTLACIGGALALLMWLLLPAMLRQLVDLARVLPRTLAMLSGWIGQARLWLEQRLPGVALPELDFGGLQGVLAGVAGGTFSLAVNLADLIGRASLIVVLAYFFLCDRDRLLLRLELLLPQAARATAVRMGNAVSRELRLYLRGQLMIAGAVGLLSVAGLALVGVRSALVLGPLIGLLNMIPYFGPFIGGVPAVLIALGDGWQKAALTVLALTVVQQLDGSWISPRIMGSLTGFSPALVLVGIYAGARLGGITGMLLAMPVMMATRTLFRVFVQKCENN